MKDTRFVPPLFGYVKVERIHLLWHFFWLIFITFYFLNLWAYLNPFLAAMGMQSSRVQ